MQKDRCPLALRFGEWSRVVDVNTRKDARPFAPTLQPLNIADGEAVRECLSARDETRLPADEIVDVHASSRHG